jgi:hypothetical protein
LVIILGACGRANMIKIKQVAIEKMEVSLHQFLLIINGFNITQVNTFKIDQYPLNIEPVLKAEILETIEIISNDLRSELFKCEPLEWALQPGASRFPFMRLLKDFYYTYDFDWSKASKETALIVKEFKIFEAHGFSYEIFKDARHSLMLCYLRLMCNTTDEEFLDEIKESNNSVESKIELLKKLKAYETKKLMERHAILVTDKDIADKNAAVLSNQIKIQKAEIEHYIDHIQTMKAANLNDAGGNQALILFIIKYLKIASNQERFIKGDNNLNIDALTKELLSVFTDEPIHGFKESSLKLQIKQTIKQHKDKFKEVGIKYFN